VTGTTPAIGLSALPARITRLLGGSRFAKNLTTLLTGAALAQVVPLLAAPALTRIYTPADYGVYSVFTALLTVVTVVVTLRYEFAISLPKEDGDAASILGVVLLTSLATTAMVAMVVALFRGRIVAALGMEGGGEWLWLLPPSMLMVGVYQGLNYWCNRRDQFKALAVSRVTRALSSVTANLSLGLLRFGGLGMVSSVTLGQTVANGLLIRQVWGRDSQILRSLRLGGIKAMAARHKAFALWNAPASLLDNLALTLPVLLMGRFYDVKTVGFFGLANLILGLPVVLLAGSIGQVFYQAVSEAQREGRDLYPIIRRMASRLLLAVVGPALLVVVAAPWIFPFAFGAKWEVSGQIARVLVIAHAARFVVSPLTLILPLTGHQRLSAIWKCAYFGTTVAVLLGCANAPFLVFLGAFVANEVLLYSLCLAFVLRVSKLPAAARP